MSSRVRAIAVGLAALGAALAPASAAAQAPPPPGSKSANVTPLTTLPEPNAISANFDGSLMYLSSSRGLSIYDIAKPESPQLLSHFPLPHFENEDVDTNGEILLISNDPSEGKGILYVLDVRDPRAPKVLSTVDTGIIDLAVNDFLPEPLRTGTGHTASCIQDCKWAYLAGTSKGIDIVDLRDPKNPKLAGNFAAKEVVGFATHDVQVDSEGLAWIAGMDGTAAYDTTDPLKPKLVYRTNAAGRSRYADEPVNDGKTLNDFIHHNSMRMNNASLAAPPAGSNPAAESDVVLITEEDYTRPTCEGAGQFETWKIGASGVLSNLDSFVIEVDPSRTSLCSAHYFDERGGLVAQGWYEGGTRFVDVTNPSDIKQVGYWIPDKNVTWGAYYAPTDPSGEIVYALDNARGVDVIRVKRGQPDFSTPPPGGGTGGSGSAAGGGGASNVAVKIGDRRLYAKRGKRRRYTVTVRNTGRVPANGVRVTVALPRGVKRVRGGRRAARGKQVRFSVGTLKPRQIKRLKLLTEISRRYRGRRLELTVSATPSADANPRDNYYVDRNRVKQRRRSGARAAASGRPSTLATRTSRMSEVSAPKLGPAEMKEYAYTFGRLCRIALD